LNINLKISKTARHKDGLAKVIIEAPDLRVQRELDLPFKKLHERCGIPDDLTLDLLFLASICYVIDKTVPRASANDWWTRELAVTIPVSDSKKWEKVKTELNNTLGFLTGDVWNLSFENSESDLFKVQHKKRRRLAKVSDRPSEKVTAVCLFSGGLDSLSGAINLLADSSIRRVHLVGHYDSSGASTQAELFAAVDAHYPGKAELLQVRVSHRPSEAEENTLRSRSLVFMALGIYVARAAGPEVPLYAPENGLIAINVPLTPSRGGSCSTRTMHPFFLDSLGRIFKKLGIANRIINPFELSTKGECVVASSNRALLDSIVDKSVSCSHGTRKQLWKRRTAGVKNCGYCVPCLIRRAALNEAGLDLPLSYGIDVCQDELDINDESESGNDFRAVLNMLNSDKSPADFKKAMLATAPVDRLDERAQMLERGFEEIRSLIRQKGSLTIRRAASIS
jgi:7-cyano-7-deazaguanine synthase in queuosine biosynthesis